MTVIVKPSTPVRDNPDFALEAVIVRLAQPDEHGEWDRLMDAQHYLGFRQIAGHSLRYIALLCPAIFPHVWPGLRRQK